VITLGTLGTNIQIIEEFWNGNATRLVSEYGDNAEITLRPIGTAKNRRRGEAWIVVSSTPIVRVNFSLTPKGLDVTPLQNRAPFNYRPEAEEAFNRNNSYLAKVGTVVPPRSAEFLFYLFLDSKNCDAIVGDIEERYKLILIKFGRRRANFWYWTQSIKSVGPIAWRWGSTAVKKLSGLAALVELYRRMRS
jgi:hypothetical protein